MRADLVVGAQTPGRRASSMTRALNSAERRRQLRPADDVCLPVHKSEVAHMSTHVIVDTGISVRLRDFKVTWVGAYAHAAND